MDELLLLGGVAAAAFTGGAAVVRAFFPRKVTRVKHKSVVVPPTPPPQATVQERIRWYKARASEMLSSAQLIEAAETQVAIEAKYNDNR